MRYVPLTEVHLEAEEFFRGLIVYVQPNQQVLQKVSMLFNTGKSFCYFRQTESICSRSFLSSSTKSEFQGILSVRVCDLNVVLNAESWLADPLAKQEESIFLLWFCMSERKKLRQRY